MVSNSPLQARNWDKDDKVTFPVSMRPSDASVTLTAAEPNSAQGLVVDFAQGGGGYPGVSLTPIEGETWDFTGFTCMEFRITSMSEKPIYLTARVDNPGNWQEKKWNSNAARFVKGDTKLIRVFFGYGAKGPAYPLDPAKVSQLLIFTSKASEGQSIKIESMQLTKAPVPFKPDVTPVDGFLLGPVQGDPAKSYFVKDGAKIEGGNNGQPLKIKFAKSNSRVLILPEGNAIWNLNDGHQLAVTIRNTGSSPIQPGIKAVSGNGDTLVSAPAEPIAPRATSTVIVSFINPESLHAGGKKLPFFHSNKTKAISILANDFPGEQSFEIESIRLEAPAVKLPEWVGKRPPVDGDWTMTFNEEFGGTELDRSTWNVITPNFWDKVSRFSKDNVEVKDGRAILTFEKRRGHHGDDPEHPRVNDYTTGYLDTYGKWVQRYGYYESRMKLPTANGLWPAFWLMPDRGLEAGEQWRRQSINEDAIEFDIMEFLSGWGPHRFTTAYHYDGYGKDHKATGAGVYTAHDEEGYVTTGLLWLPGLAVIYNNGREVSRWESDRISTVESNIIFTFVAGGWDNTPIKDAELPSTFEVDYVRVWQRADLASEVDGVQSTQRTLSAPTTPDN